MLSDYTKESNLSPIFSSKTASLNVAKQNEEQRANSENYKWQGGIAKLTLLF